MSRRLAPPHLRALALALILPLAGCGSDSSTGPEDEDPVVTSVVVGPAATTLSSTGATVQLSASVRDQDGQAMSGQTVTWASDAESVATVSASGLVTAVADGEATITAAAAGRSGTASVTVEIRGSLRVVTTTTGEPGAIDPDGYSVSYGGSGRNGDANGSTVIDALTLGAVTVELGSIASNCAATSATSVDVTITEEETAEASFTLECETLAGMYRWATEIGGEPVGAALGADGTIYAPTNANNAALFALAPDGTQAWSYTTAEYITGAPSIAADGTVYVGDGGGTLYALNPDGTLAWTYEIGGAFGTNGSPAIAPDGTLYVSDDAFLDAPTLYALTPGGALKWSFSDGGRSGFRALAVAADGTVYVGRDDEETGTLLALDPADGSVLWSYETDGAPVGPAIGADGTIYVGGLASFDGSTLTVDGKLYALNPDGTLAWTYQTGGGIFHAPAVAEDGTVYVASGGAQEDDDQVGSLYAVNPDGTEKWSVQLEGCPGGGPTVGADGTVYAPTGGCVFGGTGILEAYDAAGTLQWEFEVIGEFKVIQGSTSIAPDGTAYVASQLTGEIYAVKTDSEGLAASSWPKPGRDNRNSASAGAGGE